MEKKIVVGIVLTLVTIGIFAGCTETDDDGYTKEEVLELGELYDEDFQYDYDWCDYGIITNHTNRTVSIYDIYKGRITISDELQKGKWTYGDHGNYYYKDAHYPSIDYPTLATEDYIGATVKINYVKVALYDDYYEGGVYRKQGTATIISGHEIIEFNHTYWQEFQTKKQVFYTIKNTLDNDTIHLSFSVDKYGAGMFTQKSLRINHPHPDITVKLVAPEHFDNDIIFTYELLSPTVAILNATVYGTPPGRFKHGDYIVTMKYKLQSWHMYSNIKVIGDRYILVSLR